MPRDFKIHLSDILEAANKIESYLTGMEPESFFQDSKTIDAVIRNLEIIGEAAKKVPEDFRLIHPEIEWKKICGIRDILIHEYFAVDLTIVWDVCHNKIPRIKAQIEKMDLT